MKSNKIMIASFALLAIMIVSVIPIGLDDASGDTTSMTIYANESGNDSNDGQTPNTAVRSLGSAISKLSPGGTIYVTGYMSNHTVNIEKSMTIIGQDTGNQKASFSGAFVIKNVTGAVTIKNLNIYGAGQHIQCGENIAKMDLTFENCDIEMNPWSFGTLNSLTIESCVVTASESAVGTYSKWYLIWPNAANYITIKNTEFEGDNRIRAAIHLGNGPSTGTTAIIEGNTFHGMERCVQIALNQDTNNDVTITGNIFSEIDWLGDKGLEGSNNFSKPEEVGTVFFHENNRGKTSITYTDNISVNSDRAFYSEHGDTEAVIDFVDVSGDDVSLKLKNDNSTYFINTDANGSKITTVDPSLPPVFIPVPDDDFLPPVQVVQPEDDKSTEIACIAAGAVAALLAILLVATSRGKL